MDNQVVVQLGAQSCTFPPNVAAADVLLGATGSPGGSVRHSVSGVMYAGGMLVPGGQYEVVPPQAQAAAAAPGVPPFYKDVILSIGGGDSKAELVRLYSRISPTALQKVLDMHGCDMVQDPVTKGWVSFDAIELRDNILLLALRSSTPMHARVSTLEGFVESSVKGFEADATEAMHQQLKKHHSNAKVLPVREIRSADGRKREVDGAVIADGCAAILEAKQVLDDTAVTQLASCIEFIKDSALIGPATELKGKKILGFLAGRTLSNDPGKVKALVQGCEQYGYGILVSSGRSLGLGNSRVRRLPVECAIRRRVCGACSCPVRVVL